jgi:hypothetical protein
VDKNDSALSTKVIGDLFEGEDAACVEEENEEGDPGLEGTVG